MHDHWKQHATPDAHWERQARAMLQQMRAHPGSSPFSSDLYLLEHLGAGNLAPDSASMRRPFLWRAIRRYQRALASRSGHGGRARALMGPLGDLQAVDRIGAYARQAYRDAVETGYLLYRDEIEELDVRAPAIFGEQIVECAGRPLTWWTLLALKRVILIRRAVGRVDRVIEIGAGNGELARLMLATGAAGGYVIVDIPPALAVAQEVLLSDRGPADLALFDPTRTAIAGSARCAFLTPDQVGAIDRADLGLNIASFGEMTAANVRSYADLVKRLGCSDFISINSRVPHPVARGARIDESFYREIFAPEMTVRTSARWSRSLELDLVTSMDGHTGYQWLHFTASGDRP